MLLNSSSISYVTFAKPLKPVAPNLLHRRIIFPRCNATTTNVNVSERKSSNYQPNLWSYDFLQSLKHSYADTRYEDRAQQLQEEVRKMIKDENSDMWLKLELINDVKRLGLSYHYDKEIGETLLRFHSSARFSATIVHRSLHETALCFRLMREYGYDVSADTFERFKEQNGEFKASLMGDVKGVLSLYEASFLGYEGEQILDDARAFSSFHLRSALNEGRSNNMVLEEVNHALELPLHHRTQRLEARWYIEHYAKKRDSNRVLLEAAKLDFNILQSTLQNDLQEVSSWDVKAIQVLPDYMKICFLALYNTVNEFAYDALKEQGQDILPYLTKAWSDMLKAFLQEAKWSRDRHMPRFNDYLNNAQVSISGIVMLTHVYFLQNHRITEEALESLDSRVREREAASSIPCYMRESGASEEGAYKHIFSLLNETWKKMNKDRVSQSPFPKAFVETAINLARNSHCFYQFGDGLGAPDSTAKNRIRSLIIEPIALYEMEISTSS
ncbi:hypothetical protein ACSQ67_023496 [Phaseolus vulgaris]